jgi:hypothetical protein
MQKCKILWKSSQGRGVGPERSPRRDESPALSEYTSKTKARGICKEDRVEIEKIVVPSRPERHCDRIRCPNLKKRGNPILRAEGRRKRLIKKKNAYRYLKKKVMNSFSLSLHRVL